MMDPRIAWLAANVGHLRIYGGSGTLPPPPAHLRHSKEKRQ